MAALSRYCRCMWDLFLAFSHKYLHVDSTVFLGSQAGCAPSNRQAEDRETRVPILNEDFRGAGIFTLPVMNLCYI